MMKRSIYSPIDADEFEKQFAEMAIDIKRTLNINFIPILFRAYVNTDPHMASLTWQMIKGIVTADKVPRLTKEMMYMAVAHVRNCRYCTTAHFALGMRFGGEKQTFDQILSGNLDLIEPASTRACVQLAIDVTTRNYLLNESYFEAMSAAGVDRTSFGELFAVIAAANYVVSIADAFLVEADEGFKTIINSTR